MGQQCQASLSLYKRLQEIDEWIDWQPLYEFGRRIDKTGPKGGQPRKPVRWMIRGFFLQYLYQLSDPQLDQAVLDFTTFWRFCDMLASEGLVEELFKEITDQLDAKGLWL